MAEITKIEWIDHTFNPWIGCTRVSPACDNCYAAAMSHRRGWTRFEAGAPRRRTTEAYWRHPHLWNRKAEARGIRAKVFGPSLADPFDAEVSEAWRDDYIATIRETPWLDYILLTKRPQVALKYFEKHQVPDNLWPGITAEDQKMLELRAPAIRAIEAKVHVLSAEPLLGPLDATPYLGTGRNDLSWVIAGGESGPKARPSHPDWFRSLRDQCDAAKAPFFFKQWGEWKPETVAGVSSRRLHSWSMPSHQSMVRAGRKAAGAMLDGVEHRASP